MNSHGWLWWTLITLNVMGVIQGVTFLIKRWRKNAKRSQRW